MIWKVVQKQLDKKGWSVYRLSKESGVHDNTIRSIQDGTSTNPGIKTMIKIVNALNISLDEFREDKDESI